MFFRQAVAADADSSLSWLLSLQGSDAREMVMMSLVHEHSRGGAPSKRARLGIGQQAPITPLFTGALCFWVLTCRSLALAARM